MWALALVLAGLPLKVETRPGGEVKVPLAQITLGSGSVTVTAGKTTFPAKAGIVLGAGDVLTLGADAWVTLALATNEHVVRLDDELTVKVEALAMLKASKQTRTYKQQLDALVTPKEQEGALRLAGWHATAMAANVPTGGGADLDEGDEEKKEEDSARKEPAKQMPAPKNKMSTREAGNGPGAPPPPASTTPTPAPAVQPAFAPFVVDAELTTCLENEMKALGGELKTALGAKVSVKARRKDGALQVRVGVGLATPACASAWVERRELTADWRSLVVTLP